MEMEKYPNNSIGDNAREIDTNTTDISDARGGLIETFDATLINAQDVADCREAIIELYNMIGGTESNG